MFSSLLTCPPVVLCFSGIAILTLLLCLIWHKILKHNTPIKSRMFIACLGSRNQAGCQILDRSQYISDEPNLARWVISRADLKLLSVSSQRIQRGSQVKASTRTTRSWPGGESVFPGVQEEDPECGIRLGVITLWGSLAQFGMGDSKKRLDKLRSVGEGFLQESPRS